MDSGPEGPNGHRWVGGWHPHRQHRRQRQHPDKERQRERERDHTTASDTTHRTTSLSFSVFLSVQAADPLNKDKWSFVCMTLHESTLLNACEYMHLMYAPCTQ